MGSLLRSSIFPARDRDALAVFYKTWRFSGRRIWYFSAYKDIRFILSNHELLSNERPKSNRIELLLDRCARNVSSFVTRSFVGLDPPQHTRLRTVAGPAFTPQRLEALEPYVERIVGEILADLSTRQRVDIISEFAQPVATKVFSKVMGFPKRISAHSLLSLGR